VWRVRSALGRNVEAMRCVSGQGLAGQSAFGLARSVRDRPRSVRQAWNVPVCSVGARIGSVRNCIAWLAALGIE
jgi:hypothetical protein